MSKAIAVNEPRSAVGTADHLGFTAKPNDTAIPRNYAVSRSQGFARQEHFGGLNAPALLIVGMNLLVPAHRIFKPLRLRKTERRFNLRADIGFADSPIEIGHENNGGELLD